MRNDRGKAGVTNMLKMKWMTDHDGRLFATWTQSAEPGSSGQRGETIMLKMKWTMDYEARLVSGWPLTDDCPHASGFSRVLLIPEKL
jgi:hypothetical protein